MNFGFWSNLKKPFFALAPLADVTDAAFRRIIVKHGKPDILWTEFVSADGLCSPGRQVLLHDLSYIEAERPIIVQLFGASEEQMEQAVVLVRELGFDGVDINMGCPDKSVEKQGAGAAHMKNKEHAQAIIRAAKRGAQDLPVSVKIRIGYNKDELEEWLGVLLAEEPAAITVHARTRKEMSKVPARWEAVSRAVALRDKLGSKTFILGNGDVVDLADGLAKVKSTGADGVMLGRAIFGNPWLFNSIRLSLPSIKEKLEVMIEHTKLFQELLGGVKSFGIMKKHFKAYVEGFDGAKDLRVKLMATNNAEEVENITRRFIQDNQHRGIL